MEESCRMREDIEFSVDPEGPIAVYVQIENQIQFAIAAGKLKAMDPLPSVRDMSTSLKVNPNTVTKAYRDLELLGVVITRRGIGGEGLRGGPGELQGSGDDHGEMASSGFGG